MSASDRVEFIRAALWHGSLDAADRMLAADPSLATRDVHTAAIVGDAPAVRRFLSADPACVSRTSEPYGGDALNYLCLSRYLRLDPSRSDGFLDAARALLDAGADPNTGFWTQPPHPERETALYGAAGVAHHPGLTALLLARGADPNDEEVVYHSPETDDFRAMRLVVETGKVTPGNLALMLIRKADWHDLEGVRYLLQKGADPNERWGRQGLTALHHAIQRDNWIEIVIAMLDHGANPASVKEGWSAVERAARRGRHDLLELFESRGFRVDLSHHARLIAACARGERAEVARLTAEDPSLAARVANEGNSLLPEFAGVGNAAGVSRLLELGVPVDVRYGGDGYFSEAPDSTALHVASWRLREVTVRVLLAAGADPDARDAEGRTPLQLAVKACTDSYWTFRRSPAVAAALIAAGASRDGIVLPTGYDSLDLRLGAT